MKALMKQQWKASWIGSMVWSAIMGSLSFLIVLSFPPFQKQGQQLTQALQNISFLKNLKELTEMSTLDGFVNGQWLIMLPFVLSFFAVLGANQIYTREKDTRSIEFMLSLPISRTNMILARFIVLAQQLALIHAAIFIGLFVGKVAIQKSGSLLAYFEILCNDVLVVACFGTLALFISMFFSDYTKSLVVNIGVAILLYFENMIAKAVNLPFQEWNILYWCKNEDMLRTREFPLSSLAYELCFVTVFLALSLWAANKKDV